MDSSSDCMFTQSDDLLFCSGDCSWICVGIVDRHRRADNARLPCYPPLFHIYARALPSFLTGPRSIDGFFSLSFLIIISLLVVLYMGALGF